MQSPAEIVRIFDFGSSSAVLGPDVTLRDMATPGRILQGRTEVAAYLAGLRLAFAKSRLEVQHQWVIGETVTEEFVFRGVRQVRGLGAIAPCGKDLCLPMCAIYRTKDGQVAEISLYYNAQSIAVQLHG